MSVYTSYSDGELVALLQKNDDRAFREIYERYWDRLMARAMMQLRSAEDAEELLQDIFVKLWKRRESLQLKHSFHTYIAAVLKYEIIRRLADNKIKRSTSANEIIHTELPDHSTQQWLDYKDLKEQLEASVEALPGQCQLVFRLSREQGLSEKEIAATLQIKPKTVQNHMNRAIKKLKHSFHQLFSLFSL